MSRIDSLLDHALKLRNEAGEYVVAGSWEHAGPMVALATLETMLALALIQRARAAHVRRQPGLEAVPEMMAKALAATRSGPDPDAWVEQIEAIVLAAREAVVHISPGNPARKALEDALAGIVVHDPAGTNGDGAAHGD